MKPDTHLGENARQIEVSDEIGDGEAMMLVVMAGAGLCQMPRSLLQDDIEAGRLVEVLQA